MLQAKRTNVGIALVGEPRVLFLDEPTSGLDSYTASGVMQVVQARCKQPESRALHWLNMLIRSQAVTIGLAVTWPRADSQDCSEVSSLLSRT